MSPKGSFSRTRRLCCPVTAPIHVEPHAIAPIPAPIPALAVAWAFSPTFALSLALTLGLGIAPAAFAGSIMQIDGFAEAPRIADDACTPGASAADIAQQHQPELATAMMGLASGQRVTFTFAIGNTNSGPLANLERGHSGTFPFTMFHARFSGEDFGGTSGFKALVVPLPPAFWAGLSGLALAMIATRCKRRAESVKTGAAAATDRAASSPPRT